jgi:putative hydrolase of the HAD superfamily
VALDRLSLVTLDALGTLVALDDPDGRLRAALAARGADVTAAQARAAMRAEMAYYRAHHDDAVDDASLAVLRARCARVMAGELPPTGLGERQLVAVLLEAIRFTVAPGAGRALRAWRARGTALVVVSNWDVSLHGVLREAGLAPLVDAVVTSAEAGVAKPDPAIFALALARAGVDDPAAALHVGDSLEHDVAGALAAGMRAALVTGGGPPPPVPPGTRVVARLDELAGAEPPLAYPHPDR